MNRISKMNLIPSNPIHKFNAGEFVITESKCVFEIKNFKNYTLGEVICSDKVDIFDCDIEWKVRMHPYYDPMNTSLTLFELNINLKSENLWKSKKNEYRFSGTLGESGESFKIFEGNFTIIDTAEIRDSSCYTDRSTLIHSGTESLILFFTLEIKQIMIPITRHRRNCATNGKLKLVDQYLNLLNDSTFSDFTFTVKGTNFKVHKNILAIESEPMRAMFTSNLREAASAECNVDHIEPDIFKHMLHFIYAGIISPNLDDISIELYKAADYYRIVKLMEICKENICFNVSATNALKIYELATFYDMEDLKADAWSVIRSQLLNVTFPLKNEPLPLDEIQEIIDMREKEQEFWLKHKK